MTEELEDLAVLPATRSPHGYLASQLTDNIHMTDEGYLIVVGCPIARTGWQKYTVADLPKERAAELGIDVSNPSATIDLYRPASEVFNPEFLASLNGKPITDGHPPGGEFVDPDNFHKYAKGHIQNVRKGLEPLEDGEWPVIADLVISAEPLISKVRNKIARENSLGYDFSIDRDGDKIIQCSMLGNHSAVVPKGRAGDYVRIEDAAPEEVVEQTQHTELIPAPVAEVIEAITYPPIKFSLKLDNKEKQPVSAMQKLLRLVGGKHLIESARATDADPDKIMELAEALTSVQPVGDKARAKDDAEPPKDTEKNEFKSDDKKGKDNNEDGGAMDAKAKDRKAAHDALDKAMDKSKGRDANVAALKTLLDEFLSEEEKEPEHADDVNPAELEEVLAGEAEDCPECGTAHDSEECPGEELVESGEEEVGDEEPDEMGPEEEDHEPADDRKKATDRSRAADGAMATLKFLRPFAARTTDKAFQKAFNNALAATTKSSRTSTGSYGKFASSARARDKAPRNPNPDRARAGDSKVDQNTKLQEFYDSARKGGK